MNPSARNILSALAVGLVLAVGGAHPVAAEAASGRYLCLPCGSPCDTAVFKAPGVCPVCGMQLVEQAAAEKRDAEEPPARKVAIVVFNCAEIIDFTGPYEMSGAAGCDVYLVAETRDPVTTAMGLAVVPKFTFADAPQPDVLLIPGGSVRAAERNEALLRYIRETTAHTQNTMSVCNGAFILASTGLLDGLSATTTNGNIPLMASTFPKVRLVRDRRVVDNGKLITTAGLSAGMDGALHVIARLYGTGIAQQVALDEEYNWQTDRDYSRAALADNLIPKVPLDDVGTFHVVRTEGDTRHWDVEARGHSDLTHAELMNRLERALEQGKWTKVGSGATSPSSRSSTWRFTDPDDHAWRGTLKLESVGDSGHEFTTAFSIERKE